MAQADKYLKRAQTLIEQIYAGITEDKAKAKENVDIRQELKGYCVRRTEKQVNEYLY